ncbi:MAG TPA: L-threonylcarbamoyladenylate synthase, partial [Bacteroidota bacterium]
FNPDATRKIFTAKGRPSDNPLIVHIADRSFLHTLTPAFPEIGTTLANAFWPGPLTIVIHKSPGVTNEVTAGLDTVAIRMPNHPVALSLIRKFGRGIVAPSANISGRPSPTTGQHVRDDLDGKIDCILDAGPTTIGVESTVLDITVDPPVILRKGGLTREAIEAVIGKLGTGVGEELSRRSPGNRHRHYSPNAKVVLVKRGDSIGLGSLLAGLNTEKEHIGCILHSIPDPRSGPGLAIRRVSPDPAKMSHALFDLLRTFDKMGIGLIIVEEVEEQGLGAALMDRLRRASMAGTKK